MKIQINDTPIDSLAVIEGNNSEVVNGSSYQTARSSSIETIPSVKEAEFKKFVDQQQLLNFRPYDLTGCMLSGLLTAKYALPNTIGEFSLEVAIQHFNALNQLDLDGIELGCGNYQISQDDFVRFSSVGGLS